MSSLNAGRDAVQLANSRGQPLPIGWPGLTLVARSLNNDARDVKGEVTNGAVRHGTLRYNGQGDVNGRRRGEKKRTRDMVGTSSIRDHLMQHCDVDPPPLHCPVSSTPNVARLTIALHQSQTLLRLLLVASRATKARILIKHPPLRGCATPHTRNVANASLPFGVDRACVVDRRVSCFRTPRFIDQRLSWAVPVAGSYQCRLCLSQTRKHLPSFPVSATAFSGSGLDGCSAALSLSQVADSSTAFSSPSAVMTISGISTESFDSFSAGVNISVPKKMTVGSTQAASMLFERFLSFGDDFVDLIEPPSEPADEERGLVLARK